MRKIILLALAMAALPAWANSATYVEAKAFADRDEASVPKERTQALLETQGEAIGHAMSACGQAASSGHISGFVVVAAYSGNGCRPIRQCLTIVPATSDQGAGADHGRYREQMASLSLPVDVNGSIPPT